jgi:predicted TIM-barrel fold metal-dependent hydrolase
MTLAQRLRGEIEARGLSVKAFQERMQARGVKGGTYASVHSYVKGDAEPSLDFIVAAAEELGVLPAWLAFDIPPRTELEREATAGGGNVDLAEWIGEDYRGLFGHAPPGWLLGLIAYAALQLAVAYPVADSGESSADADLDAAVRQRLRPALRAVLLHMGSPFLIPGVRRTLTLPEEVAVFSAMLQVLLTIAPEQYSAGVGFEALEESTAVAWERFTSLDAAGEEEPA